MVNKFSLVQLYCYRFNLSLTEPLFMFRINNYCKKLPNKVCNNVNIKVPSNEAALHSMGPEIKFIQSDFRTSCVSNLKIKT